MKPVVWRVGEEARLDWKRWDDDFVIYHENSGNTFYLNLFAATALKLLLEGPASAEALARSASLQLSVPFEKGMPDAVTVMLSELRSLGITAAEKQ